MKRKILTIAGAIWFILVFVVWFYFYRLTGIINCGAPFCFINLKSHLLLLNVFALPSWILFLIALKMKTKNKWQRAKIK